MLMEELHAHLIAHGIDPHEFAWGSGKARTIEKLLRELNDGECELVSVRHHGRRRLVRRTHILMIEVYFDLMNGKRIALVETAHVRNLDTFASPKSFVDRRLDVTLTEKGKRGESPLEAAIRALIEELRLAGLRDEDIEHLVVCSVGEMFEPPVGDTVLTKDDAATLLAMLDTSVSYPPWRPQQRKYTGVYESPSYPGLLTESKAHWFVYVMRNRDQFALGYHDRDGNKLTTYDWRDITRASRR